MTDGLDLVVHPLHGSIGIDEVSRRKGQVYLTVVCDLERRVLGGGFLNSRLLTRIRQREGLSYTVSSRISANILDKVGSFSAFAICAPQNEVKVGRAFHRRNISGTESFTAEEIAAAKSGYLQARQVDLAEDGNVASILADRMFYGRDFRWEEKFNSKIHTLTSEQISKAMRQYNTSTPGSS